jgi:hypothetical protein
MLSDSPAPEEGRISRGRIAREEEEEKEEEEDKEQQN